MAGFNRRHAPGYTQCLDHPRDLNFMHKDRVGLAEEPRTAVFDDFITWSTTLRYLVPAPIEDGAGLGQGPPDCCTTSCCTCPATAVHPRSAR